MVGCDYMEVIAFSVSVNHVNGSLLDFTFLIPFGVYLLLCYLLKIFYHKLLTYAIANAKIFVSSY